MASVAALLSLGAPTPTPTPTIGSNPNPRIYRHSHHQISPSLLPIKASSSISLPPLTLKPPTRSPLLTHSTRTLTTLFSLSGLLLKSALSLLPNPHSFLPNNLALSVGPLFFASLRGRPSGALNTPLTVVAAGLGKWLDIYSAVLLVRVLLSWFPNIPWDRQPLSAMRDLCDPYLNIFRNIIPPLFGTLDVSPLLAFFVLGGFANFLRDTATM